MEAHTEHHVRGWIRIALVALGVPNLFAGAWAVLSPQGWFDDFPGWDPRLVAAEPPFNEHLATDAGAGLLASGLVVLVAAWMATAAAVRVGVVGYAAFAIPHAAWHVLNPSTALSTGEDLVNAGTLGFGVIATVVLWIVVERDARQEAPAPSSADVEQEPSAVTH